MIKLKNYFLIAFLFTSSFIMAGEGVASKVTFLSESDPIDNYHYPTTDYVHGKFEKKTAIVAVEANTSALTAVVGNYYNLGTLSAAISVTLPTMTSSETSVKTITFFATMGSDSSYIITFDGSFYKSDFTLEAGKTYEISALWNNTAWVITAIEVSSSNS